TVSQENRERQLRDRREEEAPERFLYCVPEVRVVDQRREVVEPDEAPGRVEQRPVGQRDPGRVPEREQPERAEEDEEGRDVEVRRGLRVEPVQPAPDRAARASAYRSLHSSWFAHAGLASFGAAGDEGPGSS